MYSHRQKVRGNKMKSGFLAFFKKEWMQLWRSGKLMVLLMISVLFGVMNPAIARLTPWLMEQMAEELEETGLLVSAVTVDASMSFAQFFKNIPIVLILFIFIFGGSLVGEWEKGTLIPLLTRGLSRSVVVAVKTTIMVLLWTIGYWLCFGITLGYSLYFWSGEKMARYALAAVFPYLFGLWVIIMLLVFSVPAKSATGVLMGLAVLVVVCYLAGMLPGVGWWLPTYLMSAQTFVSEYGEAGGFARAAVVSGISGAAGYLGVVFGVERKMI